MSSTLREGYITKSQKQLSNYLEGYIYELKREVIKLDIIHWNDTVIDIAVNRVGLRFCGNKEIALYIGYSYKDKEGLDEGKILLSLDKEIVVMHEHNIVSYNDDYNLKNVESCLYLLRN